MPQLKIGICGISQNFTLAAGRCDLPCCIRLVDLRVGADVNLGNDSLQFRKNRALENNKNIHRSSVKCSLHRKPGWLLMHRNMYSLFEERLCVLKDTIWRKSKYPFNLSIEYLEVKPFCLKRITTNVNPRLGPSFCLWPAGIRPSLAPPWSGSPSPQSYSSPPGGLRTSWSGPGCSSPSLPVRPSPFDSSPSSSPPGRSTTDQTSRKPESSASGRSPMYAWV